MALEPGAKTLEPLARSSTYSERFAVVVATGRADELDSGQTAASAYAKRLRELGFSVTAIGPSRRFDADAAFRDLSAKLPPYSEVALVVAGATLARGDELFLTPEDLSFQNAMSSNALAADALPLSLVIRSIQRARPSRIVGVVDDCRVIEPMGGQCPLQAVAGGTGANLISISGVSGSPADRQSTSDTLIELMTQEGLTFAALFDRLTGTLMQRGARMSRTVDLSTTFTFLPSRFFESLDHPCNRDATGEIPLDAAQRRVRACDVARNTWSYADHFARAQAFSMEQLAFASTQGSCGPAVRAAIQQYRDRYPNGAVIAQVNARAEACRREATPPQLTPPPPTPPTPPPAADSFDMRSGVDFPEGDIDVIRDVSFAYCKERCAGASQCVAFTYNTAKNVCFLKQSVSRVRTFRQAISGVKRGTATAATVDRLEDQPVYEQIHQIFPNVDLQNYGDEASDYAIDRNSTYEECKSSCERDRRCRAFTFNISRKTCFLKSSVRRSAKFLGAISGVKY